MNDFSIEIFFFFFVDLSIYTSHYDVLPMLAQQAFTTEFPLMW